MSTRATKIRFFKSDMDKNDGKPREISADTAIRDLGEQLFDVMLESGSVHCGRTSWHTSRCAA